MISDSTIELSVSAEQKDIFSTRVPYVQKINVFNATMSM